MLEFYGRNEGFCVKDLGILPLFFSDLDPRSAAEQLNTNYSHGGGFIPFGQNEFELFDWESGPAILKYPGDRPFKEIARAYLHMGQPTEELILVFDCSIVVIMQENGVFAVTRCD